MEISELMSKNVLDIMCLSETKIDGSFPIAQFNIPGFKCHRADRNEHGGGIMAYVRNELPHSRRSDLEHSTHLPVESLIFEIVIRKEKWPVICLFNPHNKYKKQCCNSITRNYWPVNVLTCFSKIFERVYHNHLYAYFDTLLSSFLTAFRKHYNCHHVLINLIEKCRQALDSLEYFGLIIMDLSKAFDCLPHRLLLCKLHKYGVSKEACQLLHSYLMRRQLVKIGCSRSEWVKMNKGVPQGSVLGPLIINIFINDIIFYLHVDCSIFNYADDNTIGIAH